MKTQTLRKNILLLALIFFGHKDVLSQVTNSNETNSTGLSAREEEIKRLSTITITSNPLEPSLLEYGSSISFLEAEQIKPRAEMSLGETLGLEPGVSSSFGGTGSSRPVIRGFSGDRVRILRNGIGSLDASNTSEDHAVTVNPLAINTVEILRGPETLLYGSSAIGGVVNTTDGTIPEKAIGRDLTGSFDLRTRTNDDEFSGGIKLEGQKGAFNWHLDSFHMDSSDYEIPGNAESARLIEQEEMEGNEHEHEEGSESNSNKLANSFSNAKGFTAGTSYITDRGFFGIAFNGFKSRYGVPGHTHGEDHEHEEEGHLHEDEHDENQHIDGHIEELHEDHHNEVVGDHVIDSDTMLGSTTVSESESGSIIDLTQYRIDSRGKIKNPLNSLKEASMKLSLSNYDHSETEDGEVATRYSNDAIEGRIEAKHHEIYGAKGSVGIQTEYSDFGAKGEEAFIPSSKRYAPALFVYESIPIIEDLRFQAGTRIEYVSLDPESLNSQDFAPLSLSAGVFYDPTGDSSYTISLSSAYTERAPSVSELFADGAHFARQIYEKGDESLGKENSYGLDLAMKKNTGMLTGGLSIFAQRYENYINLDDSGEFEDGFSVYEYTDIPALFTGLELESTFHLHEALGLYSHELDLGAQVDYVRARNTSDYSNIPRIPPLRTILKARYGYKDLLAGTIEGVIANSQNDTSENELITDSYRVINTQLDFHVPYIQENFGDNYVTSFYVRGTNLTDEEVRLSTSFIKDLAPLRGRAVLFGMRILF